MVDSALSSLQSGLTTIQSRSSDHTHLVMALMSWKRADKLVELVTSGLRPLLEEKGESGTTTGDCQPKRKVVHLVIN